MKYFSVCSGVEAASQAWEPLGWEPVAFAEVEPFPCAVLASRYPNVPNLGDITKITYNRETKELTNGKQTVKTDIDLLVGGTPCFVAGTMVLTPSGYKPIETLNVGDKVISASGKIQSVEAVGSQMANIGRLKILGRPEFVCTPNHPFLCADVKRDHSRKSPTYGKTVFTSAFTETPASEAVGKYAAWGTFKSAKQPTLPKVKNATANDIFEFLGWYVAQNGHVRFSDKRIILQAPFVSGTRRNAFYKRFAHIFQIRTDDICGSVTLDDKILANWTDDHFYCGIPYWLYSSPYKQDFLRGYFQARGFRYKDKCLYPVSQKPTAFSIADLLGNATVARHRGRRLKFGNKQCFPVSEPYVVTENKYDTPRTKFTDNHYASIVRSYTNGDSTGSIRGRVYNITVSNEHTYIVNGIATHNCQSFSVAGKRQGLEGASGLAFHYVRLIGEIQPKWITYENVPGALSSVTYGDQRDFNFLLQQFAIGGNPDLGVRYNLCWRVLDTQFVRIQQYPFAIPQRRRRVFVVGHLATDGASRCEVLLEQEGLRGNPPPRRVKGQGIASHSGQGAQGANGSERVKIGAILDMQGGKIGANFTEGDGVVPAITRGRGSADDVHSIATVEDTGVFDAQSFDVLASQSIDNCSDKYELAETCRRQNSCGVGVAIRMSTPKSVDSEPPQDGVNCLTPHDPQTERVYGANAAYPAIPANSGGGQNRQAICFNVMTCDGGSHKRADRPNGGMYVKETDYANCIASSGNGDTVICDIAESRGNGISECAPESVTSERQPEYENAIGINCQGGSKPSFSAERTDTITAASNSSGNNLQAVAIIRRTSERQPEPRSVNPNLGAEPSDAIPIALRGRGEGWLKLPETDMVRAAYSLTHATTDSMVCTMTPEPVAYKLDATQANSMKSKNPHSGFHETAVYCALDTTDPNPTKAQGGVAIVERQAQRDE